MRPRPAACEGDRCRATDRVSIETTLPFRTVTYGVDALLEELPFDLGLDFAVRRGIVLVELELQLVRSAGRFLTIDRDPRLEHLVARSGALFAALPVIWICVWSPSRLTVTEGLRRPEPSSCWRISSAICSSVFPARVHADFHDATRGVGVEVGRDLFRHRTDLGRGADPAFGQAPGEGAGSGLYPRARGRSQLCLQQRRFTAARGHTDRLCVQGLLELLRDRSDPPRIVAAQGEREPHIVSHRPCIGDRHGQQDEGENRHPAGRGQPWPHLHQFESFP